MLKQDHIKNASSTRVCRLKLRLPKYLRSQNKKESTTYVTKTPSMTLEAMAVEFFNKHSTAVSISTSSIMKSQSMPSKNVFP